MNCLLPLNAERNKREIIENNDKMSNDNLAIYTGYQYRVHVQGYEVIEIEYVHITRNNGTDNKQ